MKYAQIAFDIPGTGGFTYAVPESLVGLVARGLLVTAPFGRRSLTGLCVGLSDASPVAKTREIASVAGPPEPIPEEVMACCAFLSGYYCCALGEALSAALPGGLAPWPKRRRAKGTELLPSSPPSPRPTLNREQAVALEAIEAVSADARPPVFLLKGVTGSGKTEVYLRAIESALARGRGAIVLVPEIALTPQTVRRFTDRLGSVVAVLHSGMTDAHRRSEWLRLRSGAARVAIGARSAVFAPVGSLGVVVVDEEHESSFKQDSSPRYHARDLAVWRAHREGAIAILASATPSLESYRNAREGKYRLLTLKTRPTGARLPEVELVDVRYEKGRGEVGKLVSRRLADLLAQTAARGHQAILFLNRRGFSTHCWCPRCGAVGRCPDCDIALTFHKARNRLVCHYCGREEPPGRECRSCLAPVVKYLGTGTEKVEEWIGRELGSARVARLDSDIASTRGSHERILGAFERRETDILVGTQMVAKGLDFPGVTLVGVLDADIALNIPDYRAAERTFQLICQVAGRAGRASLPGRVVVQTATPEHYAIQAAVTHDYDGFAAREMAFRKATGYPPFGRLARLLLWGPEDGAVKAMAVELARRLREGGAAPTVRVLGPAQPLVARVSGNWRWQILVKGPDHRELRAALRPVLEHPRESKGVHTALDVDPVGPV